jgi:hypothetical protein
MNPGFKAYGLSLLLIFSEDLVGAPSPQSMVVRFITFLVPMVSNFSPKGDIWPAIGTSLSDLKSFGLMRVGF